MGKGLSQRTAVCAIVQEDGGQRAEGRRWRTEDVGRRDGGTEAVYRLLRAAYYASDELKALYRWWLPSPCRVTERD